MYLLESTSNCHGEGAAQAGVLVINRWVAHADKGGLAIQAEVFIEGHSGFDNTFLLVDTIKTRISSQIGALGQNRRSAYMSAASK